MHNWQPTASIENLKTRAQVMQKIRNFFADRNVLEVETPLFYPSTVTDPVQKAFQLGDCFLQTSPEYAMKRLLAAGSGDIFQICKAFRDDEVGRIHNPEFTMLEWYRIGFNLENLMDETSDLLQLILNCEKPERITYQDIFLSILNIDPLDADVNALKNIAAAHNISLSDSFDNEGKDTWLDILMTHIIEPQVGKTKPTFIYHYPASQAALAKINPDKKTAKRFEVYFQGMELSNGYDELLDPNELEKRFHQDNLLRKSRGLPKRPIDEKLLAAQRHGIPDCSGVSLGLDRLMMLVLQAKHIKEAIAFPAVD
ncbi:MAG: elongation factor P--(R)-beta-lysine ligase [Gammaproteobacteria bacterium]|jgi:lysyl-tRNA synthetase class 2